MIQSHQAFGISTTMSVTGKWSQTGKITESEIEHVIREFSQGRKKEEPGAGAGKCIV
jgi:hypothetical protein